MFQQTLRNVLNKLTKKDQNHLEHTILLNLALEKLGLLEAQCNLDHATTSVAYRNKRIASLKQSLEELHNEVNNTNKVPASNITPSGSTGTGVKAPVTGLATAKLPN